MDEEQRAALGALVGEWSVTAVFPYADMGDVEGRTTFEWALDGQYLLERSTVDHPAAPDALMMIAPAAEGGGFTQHYFDTRGVVRLYRMELGGGVWTLTREEADFSPLPFSQRFTARLEDGGDAIEGAWEKTGEDGSWGHDFAMRFVRVG